MVPSLENFQSGNSVHFCYTMIHKSLQSDCTLSSFNDGAYTGLVFPSMSVMVRYVIFSGFSRLILREIVSAI
jgi:hypothetical protein